ncbi:MAG: nickel pincer cofactor biosynthesis protein LarB [Chloroflexi bacterium]|nr:nickel pincer cofactor biosynthesis protein LarB [Chloroflexota bacterium]
MGKPLDDLFDALAALENAQGHTLKGDVAKPDLSREHRKGVPEVILAEGKETSDVVEITRHFLSATGRAIVSRISPSLLDLLRQEFPEARFVTFPSSKVVVLRQPGSEVETTGGKVGIITAGTSDIPVAEQSKVVAMEMGCEVMTSYDVGVAGIHRLFRPLKEMIDAGVDVIIVAAGMDGALPSVVAGLVDVPVIGLPTSVGYGMGGKGVTALLSMLQTCSPGLTVVNIDNGVGAGATAALIANRVARVRAQLAVATPQARLD